MPVHEPSLDAVLVVQTFFLVSAATGLVLGTVPALRRRYMDYGIRSHAQQKQPALLGKAADALLTLRVPHRYFGHYYVVSVAASAFWGYQLWTKGTIVQVIHKLQSDHPAPGMTLEQVWLCWALMLFQGCRRLGETRAARLSKATMPLSIYAVGVLFYLMVNIAIWIEGTGAVLHSPASDQDFTWPTAPLLTFGIASTLQFLAHRYLNTLPRYTLPTNLLFRYIVCPHYAMECLIYLALARLAAPTGEWFNSTLLCVCAFVIVNLGVVADSTREWWRAKFGDIAVQRKWRMLPPLW